MSSRKGVNGHESTPVILNIAVLFDGAGLSRLGLEQAGHKCTGFEVDPAKHYLSKMVGSGNCILADVRDVDLAKFDAVWASPPCQERSAVNCCVTETCSDLLKFSLSIMQRWANIKVLWVENVLTMGRTKDGLGDTWGRKYNAAQFLETPIQTRNRIIGGNYRLPSVWREYRYMYPDWNICPAILAQEGTGGVNESRKAGRWYGRRLSLAECSYHQGFQIPQSLLWSWYYLPPFSNPQKGKPYTWAQWKHVLYSAIGNGVPVYMARSFGEAYSRPQKGIRPISLFSELENVV